MKNISINLKSLYEFSSKMLELECVYGEHLLNRSIQEAVLNRPGLALSGFQKYFAKDRIQVLGMAEYAYLRNLDSEDRRKALTDFFKHRFPCLILARNRKALPEMIELAKKYDVPILRTPMVTYDFIHSATVLIAHLTAPRKKLQGTMMDIRGIGVLIQGDAMIGKTETALGLLEMGHSLVADEVTIIRQSSWGGLIGSSVELTKFHMEIRGLGIVHVPSLYGIASVRAEKQLDLIVKLYRPEPGRIDSGDQLSGDNQKYVSLFGISVPLVSIPVTAGRNIAEIVEVAALNQKLKQSGHDATKELDARVIDELLRKRGASD
jgi:HPr kinase/phosphorylase